MKTPGLFVVQRDLLVGELSKVTSATDDDDDDDDDGDGEPKRHTSDVRR